MGCTNPFDDFLDDRDQERVPSELEEAEAAVQPLLDRYVKERPKHEASWVRVQEQLHHERYEQALAEERAADRFIPALAQKKLDEDAEAAYGHIRDIDELLQIPTLSGYLAARRVWDRRVGAAEAELTVVAEVPDTRTALQAASPWTVFTSLLALALLFSAVKAGGVLGLALLPVFAVIWLALSVLPKLYGGTLSEGGRRGGGFGSAV